MIALNELFSYSKINTYEDCSFKYKLIYVDKHSVFTGSIATEFGTLIHQAEESIAHCIQEGQSIDYTTIISTFTSGCENIKLKYPTEYMTPDKSNRTYEEKAQYYANIGVYRLEQFMTAHPSFKIVGIEQNFKVAFNQCIFRGAIDRVIYDTETDTYIIQDIKSYCVPLDKSHLTTPLQFVVYTLASKELYNCSEKQIKCQYDIPLCDVVQDAGTTGYMNRGTAKLEKLLSKIDSDDFEPNPTPLCYWCPFSKTNPQQPVEGKNLCPYHSLWTKTNKSFAVANIWQGMDKHNKILESYFNVKATPTVSVNKDRIKRILRS